MNPDSLIKLRCARSGNTGLGHVYLGAKRAGEPHAIRYPILVAEGFPGGHTQEYLLGILSQHGLLATLHGRGYDLILIGFDQGSDRIQNNAGVVEDGIAQVQTLTPEPLVVGGLSMGGLVTRYALTRMEHENRDHRTRTFFTLDTPHRGACTSLAAQWFAHSFRGASELLAGQSKLLDSPANQQFMTQWLHQGQVTQSPLRTEFLADLQRIGGYPKRPLRWALASGAGDGRPTLMPHQAILDWTAGSAFFARLFTQGSDGEIRLIAQGRCLDSNCAELHDASAVSWEAAPGGQGTHLAQVAQLASLIGGSEVQSNIPQNCTVPTFSALDLELDPFTPIPEWAEAPNPMFNGWAFATRNLPHLHFDPAMRDWLLDRIEAFNPHGREFQADPYPVYARLRRTVGVARVAPYRSWWVFRDADVRVALRDTARFSKDPPVAPDPTLRGPFEVGQALPDGPFSADPPWHTALRAVLDPGFRQSIDQAGVIATAAAQHLLASFTARGRTELVASYALPLPARVLFEVLGILPDASPQLAAFHEQAVLGWVTAIISAHDITQSQATQLMGGTCNMALGNYFQGLLRRQPAHPPRGLVDRLIVQADEREQIAAGKLPDDGKPRLGRDQLQASLVSISIAGYLSTTFLICTGLMHLQSRPDLIERLLKDTGADDKHVVDELLRLDAPAQMVDRIVAVDGVSLSGVPLAKGDKLALVLGSANRDENVFPDPDACIPERPNAGDQLSFGDGIHRCLGEPLARRVTPVALRELFRALPRVKVDGTAQWQTDPYLRGPSNLPVSWD